MTYRSTLPVLLALLALWSAPAAAQFDDDCDTCIVLPDPNPGGAYSGCYSPPDFDITADVNLEGERVRTTYFGVPAQPVKDVTRETLNTTEDMVADRAAANSADFFGLPHRTEYWIGGERELYRPALGRRVLAEFTPTSNGTVIVRASFFDGHLYMFYRRMLMFNYVKMWVNALMPEVRFDGEYDLIRNRFISSSVTTPGIYMDNDAEYFSLIPPVFLHDLPFFVDDYIRGEVEAAFGGAAVDITGEFVSTVSSSAPLLDVLSAAGLAATELLEEDDVVRVTINVVEPDCNTNGTIDFGLEVSTSSARRDQLVTAARASATSAASAPGSALATADTPQEPGPTEPEPTPGSGSGTIPDKEIVLKAVADGSAPVDVRTYPNPATTRAVVELPATREGEVQISVVDVRGREVLAVTERSHGGPVSAELDVSALPPGLYLVRVGAPDRTVTTRMTVAR